MKRVLYHELTEVEYEVGLPAPGFDSAYVEQWKSFRDQYRSRMVEHIVGFEIIATRIEAKFKLSQNRTKPEQENIIRSLASSSDSAEAGVAALMRERGLGIR